MNFTPKNSVRSAIAVILTIAVVGWIGWVRQTAPIVATTRDADAAVWSFQSNSSARIVPAVYNPDASGYSYELVSSYKTKHWFKRNAPILGGAGGGALIGGLAGGGTGALIGGGIGAGGGALYKHYHHRHYHNNYYKHNYYNHNHNYYNHGYR
jgi:hypothetical protein